MQIEYPLNLSEDAHVKICKELHKQRFKWLIWTSNLIFIIVTLFCICILIIWSEIKKDKELSFLFDYFYFMCILLFLNIFLHYWRSYTYKMSYRSSKSSQKTLFIKIDDENITTKTEGAEGKMAWHLISEIREFKDWVLLMPSKTVFVPIPKTNLSNEQITWLKSKIGKYDC